MRLARLRGTGVSFYHVCSRIIERRFLLNHDEKERFRRLMRMLEDFTGVDVLTYAILDNHFHCLLHVDSDAQVSDYEVVARVDRRYGRRVGACLASQVDSAREKGDLAAVERLLSPYRARMNDLSIFMKELLQLYTQSYNRRHNRHGTLWEGRFKSTLVEGHGEALAMTAAYIDLNPVRAGIVRDPKDYRFCGYGEAAAGSSRARDGMRVVLDALGQQSIKGWGGARYRQLLYLQGLTHAKGSADSAAFREQAAKVLEQGGQLNAATLLHCRVRYFTDGVVLGSKVFVEDAYQAFRDQFGPRRRSGPKRLRNASVEDLFTLRDLRLNVITPSG